MSLKFIKLYILLLIYIQMVENAYYEDLLNDINKDRIAHGKKIFSNKNDDDDKPNLSIP